MNRNAILVILSALVLSACQHNNKPVVSEQVYTAPQPKSETLYKQQPVVVSTPRQSTVRRYVEAPAYNANLLDRIRAGFRFPDLNSKYVAEYEKWNVSHPTYLNDLFKRSEPFLFHIVEEIEKRGMPMEIALLPAVESAYKPNAVSRSKAAGLWQFIPSTGTSFGLNQDWWYDGRRDVILSTNAALDYLTQLHKRFNGDWFLALAAYNAGQGNIARSIKSNQRKGKRADYTSLNLRSETRRYIPKLIALKNIINSPHSYGVKLPVVANSPQFEIVPLRGQVDLNKFASQTGIPPKELNNLNASFLRWASAPNGPQRLLIPNGDYTVIQKARIAAQQTVKVNYQHHTIARGETLSGIARRYGVSVGALRSNNKLSNNNIRAGRRLLIPFNGNAVAANQQRVIQAQPQRRGQRIVHQVRQGDTLWGIARRYNVPLQKLLAWNNMPSNQILKLNQPLVLFP